MFTVGMKQHALIDACCMETTVNIGEKETHEPIGHPDRPLGSKLNYYENHGIALLGAL